MLMVLALGACTSNNGNIGPWFGMWKVAEIKCNGEALPEYEGNVFFLFQSNVFEMRQVSPDYEHESKFGVWSDDGKGTLTVDFPDDRYLPFEVMHFSPTDNVLTYSKVKDGGFSLTLHAASGQVFTYWLVKW